MVKISLEDENNNPTNQQLEELDEYGMRINPQAKVVKPPGCFERFFSKPLFTQKPGMEDNQGWTWGKILFIGAIAGVVVGVVGFFTVMMAENTD